MTQDIHVRINATHLLTKSTTAYDLINYIE